MKSSVSLDGTITAKLTDAILIYTANSESSYITRHKISLGELGPAQPITSRFIEELDRQLGKEIELELLPENILARSVDTIVWWTPPQRRVMFFAGQRVQEYGIERLNGISRVQPSLVWKVRSGGLSVRAMAQDTRPTADTPLLVAPYWNTSESGSVCLGSTATPKTRSVAGINVWVDGFFASQFVHPNATQLCSFPTGYLDMLSGFETIPTEYLLEAKQTLSQFINGKR